MSKNVVVISTSLRSGSNSESLADAFMEGAKAAGHRVEKITLKDKSIAFCRGCLACQKTRRCVICDDAVWIAEKMRCADVIAFATPIYYYEMSGQMKTLLDRANPLFASDCSFGDVYMLTTAADCGASVSERAVEGLRGWIDCFENAALAGTVSAGGLEAPGDVAGHQALREAFDMGKAV